MAVHHLEPDEDGLYGQHLSRSAAASAVSDGTHLGVSMFGCWLG
jgi:hypothetical protein